MIFNAASSCWSGLSIEESVEKIIKGETHEPLLGVISSEHIQLCPQHINYLDHFIGGDLVRKYPKTQFRLHADIRLKNKRGVTIDLSEYSEDTKWYFEEVALLSKTLDSKVYSLHAGKRQGTLEKLKEQHMKVQEIFGDITVAVEGLYPNAQNKWIISDWAEYGWLAENNIPYALDLSHLNIVEKRHGANENLIKELIANPLCEEIHVSFNDGNHDSHEVATDKYKDVFDKYKSFLIHKTEKSVIFTEGNQILHQRKLKRLKEASTQEDIE